MMKIRLYISILAVIAVTGSVPACELVLGNQTLSLSATNESLRSILQSFSAFGVVVRMDPEIDGVISMELSQVDISKALRELLDPHSYILLWDVVDTPVGRIPLLSEIKVYKLGHEDDVKELPVENAFNVIAGVNGGLFVDNELLLSLKSGMTLDRFKHLLAQIGGTVVEALPELGIYRVRFGFGTNLPALAEQLRYNPDVQLAEPNYVTRIPVPLRGQDAISIKEISVTPPSEGAPALAILDTGLMNLEELSAGIRGSYDAVNPESGLEDAVGHGTQMALIASGAILPGSGAGSPDAAAGVPLVAIRAFDDDGLASNFSLMRSMNYALEQGARVINMSWGSETDSDFMERAVAYAQEKDIILVAAAGNEPSGHPVYPAAYSGVLAVSAVGGDGARWPQSNYGNHISLAAAGTAAFPVGHQGPPGSYAGTSISSAYVSRALALYLGQNPASTANEAVSALLGVLTEAGEEGRDDYYGAGILDSAAMAAYLAQ